ncbi:MAG TPA: cytochrome P450 [Acidimicrobiia bacterium]|nr:cytochrome P450 [Acidimicrobiia bacterium]
MYEAAPNPGGPLDRAFSQRCADDPHAVYPDVLAECPVARTVDPVWGATVVLSKYEDVLQALKHPEIFSSKNVVNIGNDVPLLPLSVDPPDHAKYRRLLDPQFSPKRMAELEPELRGLVHEIIDTFADRGECDFNAEFATPLPSTVFLALMGLPQDDLPQFLQWRDDTIRPSGKTIEEQEAKRQAAGQAIEAYFEQAIEAKRANPDDRLLSTIVHGEVDGRPMTHAELIGTTHLLLLGGLDTVTATLDCMIVYLAQHPERRQAVVDDPSLIPAAVEELLRHQTPVMMVPRIVAQDTVIGGVEMKKGDSATLLIGAANADDAEFGDACVARFDREANRHLAFGGGPHRCLGSHLARLELCVALEEFHKRIPEYRLADDTQIRFSPGIRQAQKLPLVFSQ